MVIFDPPADPMITSTSLFWSSKIVGAIDVTGNLPGLMKLLGDGGIPYEFGTPGVEKSSMMLFKIMPVLRECF